MGAKSLSVEEMSQATGGCIGPQDPGESPKGAQRKQIQETETQRRRNWASQLELFFSH